MSEVVERAIGALTTTVNSRMEEIKGQFESGLKTETEARSELNGLMTAMQDDMSTLRNDMESMRKIKLENDSNIIRAENFSAKGAVRPLTPLQAWFGHSFISRDNMEMQDFRNRIESASIAMKSATFEQAENHIAALSAADPNPQGSHKRNWLDKMRAASLADHMNALDTGSTVAGTPYLLAAELWPLIVESATVFPSIPLEPRLQESGRVQTASPFSSANLVAVTGTTDVTAATPTQAIITMDAVQLAIRVQVTESFMEDYAFGDAIQDAIEPTMRRQGYNIDDAILFGDTTAAAADNINMLANTSTSIITKYDGLAKASITATAATYRVVAPTAFLVNTLSDAHKKMGQLYGIPQGDIMAVMPLSAQNDIVLDSKLTAMNLVDGSGNIRVGRVVEVGGIPIVIHDSKILTHTDGKVSSTAAENIKQRGVLFNRLSAKMGFTRSIRTTVREAPAGLYSNVIVHFRMAFRAVNPGTRTGTNPNGAGGAQIGIISITA